MLTSSPTPLRITFSPAELARLLRSPTSPIAFRTATTIRGLTSWGPTLTSSIYNAFTADIAANPGNYTLQQDISSQFNLIEKVSAGYLMNTIDFNKVRVVAGVRFEGTNLD